MCIPTVNVIIRAVGVVGTGPEYGIPHEERFIPDRIEAVRPEHECEEVAIEEGPEDRSAPPSAPSAVPTGVPMFAPPVPILACVFGEILTGGLSEILALRLSEILALGLSEI